MSLFSPICLQDDLYCFGWQAGGLTTDERSEVILLGGKVLNSNNIFLSILLTLDDSD